MSFSDDSFYADDSDYEYDIPEEVEIEMPRRISADIPLILEDAESLTDVAENFSFVFGERYGETHPHFFRGSLKEANKAAFKTSTLQRRPLALYLHKDDCELSHDFPRRVLTLKAVVDVLKKQFVVWGWDLTTEENRAKLEAQMEEADMRRIHREISKINPERFPVLLVVVAPQWIHQISDRIDADFDVVRVQKILLNRLNSSVDVKNASSGVIFDAERDAILKEQQRAYEMALAADRAREEVRNKEEAEEQRKREEEERLCEQEDRLEREKEAEVERKKALLPEEPSATESNVVALRLRLPGGRMVDRRFRSTEKVGFVLTLVESLGFPLATHRAFTSDRPRKNFVDLDTEKSFGDLKWPRRDVVVVEEIF